MVLLLVEGESISTQTLTLKKQLCRVTVRSTSEDIAAEVQKLISKTLTRPPS